MMLQSATPITSSPLPLQCQQYRRSWWLTHGLFVGGLSWWTHVKSDAL